MSFVPGFLFQVRYWGFVPSSGLPPLVRFVPFFPFGRSCLPPLSVITSHALLASFVVAIFLFRPFLFAPLRFAFFKVEKRKRPLFFQRWLFLHSVRSAVRLRLIFKFFLAISQLVRQAWLSMLLHCGCYALSSFLVRRSRPRASLRLPPHRFGKKFRAKMPEISSLPWVETPTARSPTKKSAVSASLHHHFFGGAFFRNFEDN